MYGAPTAARAAFDGHTGGTDRRLDGVATVMIFVCDGKMREREGAGMEKGDCGIHRGDGRAGLGGGRKEGGGT